MVYSTISEVTAFIKSEIGLLYPEQEADAIIYQIFNHTLKFSRADVYLKSDTNVPKSVLSEIEKMVIALKKFTPLQYIFGETCFYGLNFKVNQHVLIPRPETEELVEWILQEHNQDIRKVIDLGTGSGCIPVALAKNRPNWTISAVDISYEALNIARTNANKNDVAVTFFQEDMLSFSPGLTEKRFDIIISNPPYISANQKSEMLPNVLEYEPHIALFAPGEDALFFYRKIAALGKECLKPNGAVYVEMNEAYPNETKEIFTSYGFEVVLKKDIHNKTRMLKAFKPLS